MIIAVTLSITLTHVIRNVSAGSNINISYKSLFITIAGRAPVAGVHSFVWLQYIFIVIHSYFLFTVFTVFCVNIVNAVNTYILRYLFTAPNEIPNSKEISL